jgi:ABC-type bacteriocin/lantibiotic exporter with double-glycine peptidase domain
MRTLPFFRQQNEFYCGPAIVQMILAAYDTSLTQRQAAIRMKTNRHIGTKPSAMIALLLSFGYTVQAKTKAHD